MRGGHDVLDTIETLRRQLVISKRPEQFGDEDINLAIHRSILVFRDDRALPSTHISLDNPDLAAPDKLVLAQKIDICVGVLFNRPHVNRHSSIFRCLKSPSDQWATTRTSNRNNNLALLGERLLQLLPLCEGLEHSNLVLTVLDWISFENLVRS
ncbi:hypothetical protein HG531_011090 [Fusarium graminearum]|nr:hypothetical protein HG531_011090 [Fusarium graminearum]